MKTLNANRALLICFVFFGIFLCGCQGKPRTVVEALATPVVGNSQVKNFTGVLMNIDKVKQTITFQNPGFTDQNTFTFSGATNFLDSYDKQLSSDQMTKGEMVDVYMDGTGQKVAKVKQNTEFILYEGVQNISVVASGSYITVEDTKYKYSAGTVVLSNDKLIDIQEIAATDVVTIRGVVGQVYSITVDRGHGYIRPSNYKDFEGGSLVVEGETILPITKNMLIPSKEGSFQVTMKNGDLIGTQKVTVVRDKEVKLDMSLFRSLPKNTGQVKFNISPEGAELYINGSEVNYSKPVSLQYGKHVIVALLEGYTEYSGTLDVASANPTVTIDLAKEEADVDSSDDSTVTTDTDSDSSTTTVDKAHTISVNTPAGAEVYLNGTYKGIAPCSFTKVIGTETITLSKSGYTTKSYSVEISDDNKDVTWNFSALVATSDS